MNKNVILNLSSGGGTSLNFKVVGNPQPTNPKENTIWLNTDVPITSWIFSATEPNTAESGMVWFPVGTSSTVAFNALKKNDIQVYPLSAKQYIDGAWVNKTAKIFQNGEWVDWIVYLLKGTDLCENVTGGWSAIGLGFNSQANLPVAPTVTKNSNSVTLEVKSGSWGCGLYRVNEKVSLTNVDKLCIKGIDHNNVTADAGAISLIVLSEIGSFATSNVVASVDVVAENKVYELPVGNLSGDYTIAVRLLSSSTKLAKTTIEWIRME